MDTETYGQEFQPLEILNIVTAVISLVANAIIIAVIARYSVIRTRSKIYLLNWCVCNFIVCLLVQSLLSLFGLVDDESLELMCLWDESTYGVLFGNLLFVVMVLLDWYISTYTNGGCLAKFKNAHYFVITITWLLIAGVTVASVAICWQDIVFPLSLIALNFAYFLTLSSLISVYILRCIKIKVFKKPQEKSKAELIVATSYFLCWLPNMISLYGPYLHLSFSENYVKFTMFVGYSHAWIMLLFLVFCDKSFRLYFKKMFGAKDDVIEETINKEQNAGLL